MRGRGSCASSMHANGRACTTGAMYFMAERRCECSVLRDRVYIQWDSGATAIGCKVCDAVKIFLRWVDAREMRHTLEIHCGLEHLVHILGHSFPTCVRLD